MKKTVTPLTPAQRLLVTENTGLIGYTLDRYFSRLSPHLAEDANDAGLDGLCKAARYYRPERGTQFSTLAVICVKSAVVSCLRRSTSRWTFSNYCPGNGGEQALEVVADHREQGLEVVDAADDDRFNRQVVEELLSLLSPRQALALRLSRQSRGHPTPHIAAAYFVHIACSIFEHSHNHHEIAGRWRRRRGRCRHSGRRSCHRLGSPPQCQWEPLPLARRCQWRSPELIVQR